MKIDIDSKKYELNDDIKKYVEKKISKLKRQIPRKHRESVHVSIVLKEHAQRKTDRFACEARMHLPPKQEIIVEEATINMFAAVDIVEAKLRNRLVKYHSKQSDHRTDRKGVFRRLKNLAERDFRDKQN